MQFIGVPEHFNFPITTALRSFSQHSWEFVSQGTGKMLDLIANRKADVGIVLTEGYFQYTKTNSDLVALQPYITSPLNWGIHVGGKSLLTELPKTGKITVGISRFLSGSHLMPLVKKETDNWNVDIEFVIVNNLDGAIQYLTEFPDTIFFWEKFTTQPFVENGTFKRLSEYPTPWPAFLFVCRTDEQDKVKQELDSVLLKVSKSLEQIKESNAPEVFAKEFNMPLNQAEEWYASTEWLGEISLSEIEQITMPLLKNIH